MFGSAQLELNRPESGRVGLPHPISTALCGSATRWKDAALITLRSFFTSCIYSDSKWKTFSFCKGRKKCLLSSLNKTKSLLSFSVNTKRRESLAQDSLVLACSSKEPGNESSIFISFYQIVVNVWPPNTEYFSSAFSHWFWQKKYQSWI